MQAESVSWEGVLARFAAALVLVYATFNPEGVSFYHWAIGPLIRGDTAAAGQSVPVKLLAGLLLIGLWAFFVQTTRRSLGWKGAILMLAILGTIVWALIDWRLLEPTSSRAIGHLVIIALAIVLALGMSWSHLSRKLSGQVDTDDIN